MMRHNKSWLYLTVIFFTIILLYTFQSKEQTEAISNRMYILMNSMNITVSEKLLRSNAHIIEFLIFGVLLSLYGVDTNKNMTTIVAYGFGLGLIDELMRVFLPTREFEFIDLLKDWLGIVIAVFIVHYWRKRD